MHLSRAIEIAAPPSVVWDVTTDVTHWHEWTPTILGVEWVEGDSVAVGSVARITQPQIPPALWRVTDVDPGRLFSWRANNMRATFVGADLTGADLSGANLYKADFSHATLAGAKLQGANLENADLVQTDFTRADLTGARLAKANIEGAIFVGATGIARIQGLDQARNRDKAIFDDK